MRCLCVVTSTLLLLAGCDHKPTGASPPSAQQSPKETAVGPSKILKVKVTAGGDVTADDQAVTLEQLATLFARLKRTGGMVLYYRENPAGEPHPNAEKVIKSVIENKLPVRLSTQPDFSDAVSPSGSPRTDKG